jgi:O-antigen ligase
MTNWITTKKILLMDILFSILIVTNYAFEYSLLSQVSIISFVGYLLVISLKNGKLYFNKIMFLQILFIIYSLVVIYFGYSIDRSVSLLMIRSLTINFVMGLMIYNYVFFRNDLHSVIKILSYSILIFVIIVFLFSTPTLLTQRLGLIYFGNFVNVTAMASTIAIFIYIFLYFDSNKIKKKYLFYICFLFIVIILTGSRKGIFMLIIGSFLELFLLFKKQRIKIVLLALFVIIFIYVAIVYIPFLNQLIGSRVQDFINLLLSGETEDGSLIDRNRYIELGLAYFKQSPYFGNGLNTFKLIETNRNVYSHNNYIELLYGVGLIGFILFYLFIFGIYYLTFKLMKKDTIGKVLFVVFTVILIVEYAYVDYYVRSIVVLWSIFLAAGSKYSTGVIKYG